MTPRRPRRPDGEASVNSRNSPVMRYSTCSPMSTALSPTRSSARAARFMCRPQSSARGSSASFRASRWVARLSRSTGSSRAGSVRHSARSRRANASMAVRTMPTTMRAHLADLLAQGVAAGQRARGEVELRDVDGLVADPLEVQPRVQQGGDEPQIRGHRRLQGQQLEHSLVDLEVQLVDRVVGVDHGVRHGVVAGHQGLDGVLDRDGGQVPQVVQVRLQVRQFFVELLPRLLHQPNRPVT